MCHWRKKWFDQGLVGLYGEARPGRPRTHDEERVAELLRTVLDSKPADATHWTVRSAAATTGLSKSTVARTFALFGVQPHRSKHFKLSTDPEFVELCGKLGCAPKACIISGGRFHPESCRLIW